MFFFCKTFKLGEEHLNKNVIWCHGPLASFFWSFQTLPLDIGVWKDCQMQSTPHENLRYIFSLVKLIQQKFNTVVKNSQELISIMVSGPSDCPHHNKMSHSTFISEDTLSHHAVSKHEKNLFILSWFYFLSNYFQSLQSLKIFSLLPHKMKTSNNWGVGTRYYFSFLVKKICMIKLFK